MFLAHLWVTGYAAPPELGFTGARCSTNMSPLRCWERSLWVLGQSLRIDYSLFFSVSSVVN